MTQRREVIISGWLQNVRKKSGTLLRKKKFICEEALWVALCVHNDRAPHLEWYPNEDSMYDHRPKQLVDLLEVALISPVMTDSRMFIIEFKEESRSAIELCALSPDDCNAWVESARSTLNRLNCLQEDNHYLPCPMEMNFSPNGEQVESADENAQPATSFDENALAERSRDVIRLDDSMHLPLQASESNGNAAYEHIVRALPLHLQLRKFFADNQSQLIDPLFLLVWLSKAMRSQQEYRLRKAACTIFHDCLRRPPTLTSMIRLRHRTLEATTFYYPTEKDHRRVLQTAAFNVRHPNQASGSELCSCQSTDDDLYSRPLSCQSDDSSTVALEQAMTKPRVVFLQLSVCVEHLALVEIHGRVWVAGWSAEYNKQLCQVLRIGDEIIEVGDVKVTGIQEVPGLFHTQSIPGNPVSLKVRPIPTGYVCSFVKPLSGSKTLGITLHKKKNRIEAVAKNSVAGKAHLPAVVAAFSRDKSYVSTVITDIDDTPMNPFANNDQLVRRLEAIRHGAVFTITVHPHDFVKLLKSQLKQIKGYKRFVIDN
ncbi:hypothetical protein QR680_002034 [Steinernema hermaphroditum]|uniref:PH domain-containing protein n=1 Tax=Steinernema hermaphroditum TaxID=289476 RepID=A0AA39H315_9BILA|nr:hypothetical protein QR680_002034 [Steinernema hermaphroditum]